MNDMIPVIGVSVIGIAAIVALAFLVWAEYVIADEHTAEVARLRGELASKQATEALVEDYRKRLAEALVRLDKVAADGQVWWEHYQECQAAKMEGR